MRRVGLVRGKPKLGISNPCKLFNSDKMLKHVRCVYKALPRQSYTRCMLYVPNMLNLYWWFFVLLTVIMPEYIQIVPNASFLGFKKHHFRRFWSKFNLFFTYFIKDILKDWFTNLISYLLLNCNFCTYYISYV